MGLTRAPDADVLVRRWRTLISADIDVKRKLMKETRDRTIDKELTEFPGEGNLRNLRKETGTEPRLRRVGYRSFDRQYLIADQRVVDFIRPNLWRLCGERQVYLMTQLRESLAGGPAAVFSAHVPDTHHYQGHHGGRVYLSIATPKVPFRTWRLGYLSSCEI